MPNINVMRVPPGKDEVVPDHPLVVPLGEGVIGAAFKRSLPVMYVDPQLSGSQHEAAYLYSEESAGAAGSQGASAPSGASAASAESAASAAAASSRNG